MYKQFKGYLNTSIGISILGIILGLFLIIYPNTSLNLISNTISIILIVSGIVGIINDQRNKVVVNTFNMTSNIVLLIIGVILFFNKAILESIIPIVLGIAFIISGINKMKYSFILKSIDNDWKGSFIASLITTICGVVMIIRPIKASVLITTFMGIIILVYSISNMTDTIILKRKAKSFNDYFNKIIK